MQNKSSARVLAVDWGAKRIGLALSDPTQTIASPLMVIPHTSRVEDASVIIKIAVEKEAGAIVVGASYDENNQLTPSGRSAERLAEELRSLSVLDVKLVDEEGSTRTAMRSRLQIGVPKSRRCGHFDAIAAQIILQRYLDGQI